MTEAELVAHADRIEEDVRERHFIEPTLQRPLVAMAGFRNVLVHGYDDVDLAIVRDVVEHRLGDLEAFVAAVRRRLPSVSDP